MLFFFLLLSPVLSLGFDQAWLQSVGQTGERIWKIVDPAEIDFIDEPQFRLFTPKEGSTLIRNAVVTLNWTTRPASSSDYSVAMPPEVRLELWWEDQFVTMLVHAIPNNGKYDWFVRLPRAWSTEYWYHIRIFSNFDSHVFSRSPQFRIS